MRVYTFCTLQVGRKGVGDAIDSYNMNASFFTAARVRVLGAVFNKVPDDDSYYSLNNCKTAVTSYFEKVSAFTMSSRRLFIAIAASP